MFVYLSKILPQLLFPVGLCLELLLLSLVLSRRRPRAARGLLVIGIAVLWGPSTPFLSDLLLGRLEGHDPVRSSTVMDGADAIVILGGGTSGQSPGQPEVELGASGGRLHYGFRLFRAGKAPIVLLSGGSLYPGESEADQMRQVLAQWGLPRDAMVLDERSRNTHENAVEAVRLAQERGMHRLLLVTSAFHMPRALAIFRREVRRRGLDDIHILPAPTGQYVTRGRPFLLLSVLPDAGALANTTLALREYLGTFIYGLKGWL